MQTHSYPYDPAVGPVINVTVRASGQATSAKLLISTASKRSYLAPEIAKRLGLVLVSGTFVADLYFAELNATIKRSRLLAYEGLHPTTHSELDGSIEGVLGRDSMKNVQLKISGMQRLVTLTM